MSRSSFSTFHSHNGAGVEVVFATASFTSDASDELASILSRDECDRAARFVFDADRRRYIIARGRLRLLLAERLGSPPESIEITHLSRGKPVLGGVFSTSGLQFNLSHCQDATVFAFAYRRRIGVDVETLRLFRDIDRIAMRLFSRREKEIYLKLPAQEKMLGFFNCWTRKEAFIKAIGDGFQYPLTNFDVSLAPAKKARLLRVGDTCGDECGWTLHGFSRRNLVGAVVVQQSSEYSLEHSRLPESIACLDDQTIDVETSHEVL